MRLTKLAEVVIERFERLCHWLQRQTGFTNFWLAGKIALALASPRPDPEPHA
jgi:hypothetical protein